MSSARQNDMKKERKKERKKESQIVSLKNVNQDTKTRIYFEYCEAIEAE